MHVLEQARAASAPICQALDVVEAVEPDPKEVVHQDGAVPAVGVNQEEARRVGIIIGISHSRKGNLRTGKRSVHPALSSRRSSPCCDCCKFGLRMQELEGA